MTFIDKTARKGENILIEGSQSFGLSNYHGDYPFSTSRNTTVGEFLGQVGIGPGYLDEICLVIKCFPTRNQGGDGNLPNELSLEKIQEIGHVLEEYGGGSYDGGDKKRRVGLFDYGLVKHAIIANTPDYIALTGLDRLRDLEADEKIKKYYGSPQQFIQSLENEFNIPVIIRGWGPNIEDVRINKNERFL